MTEYARKAAASYYTPPSLVAELLRSALDPLITRALEQGGTVAERRRRLLALKTCDPSCGAAAFLLAAARRIGRAVALLDARGNDPDGALLRRCVREVIGHCIYGVDLNPLAVELSRLVLWIEAEAPGLPNQFLDHRLKCGNALVGAPPELVAAGVPDGAFSPRSGDDRATATRLRCRNAQESGGALAFTVPMDALAPGTDAEPAERGSPQWWAALAQQDEGTALWRRRLGVMVPLRSQEYEWDGGIADGDRERIRGYLGPPHLFTHEDPAQGTQEAGVAESLVAFGGDAVLWAEAAPGRSGVWTERVVDALAVLSFAPGGAHMCGLSWQSSP